MNLELMPLTRGFTGGDTIAQVLIWSGPRGRSGSSRNSLRKPLMRSKHLDRGKASEAGKASSALPVNVVPQ